MSGTSSRLPDCALCIVLFAIFGLAPVSASADQMRLATSAFANGATIPATYTCAGANESPPLEWTGVPASAVTVALMVDDPDAPSGTFVHWVLYDIPVDAVTHAGKMAENGTPPPNARQGTNGFGDSKYGGPCPPPGAPHHYHFKLYALDTKLGLPPGARAEQVEEAMRAHILASTELIGIFGC
jgi:Raf kinase inhibitor-like YbhB/YbcL family protein